MTPYNYTKRELPAKTAFLSNRVPKFLLFLAGFMAILYSIILIFWFQVANMYLFGLLVVSQIFFLWQGMTFLYTVWNVDYVPEGDDSYTPLVDVFITVAGEPVDIVEDTVRAALMMDYPSFKIHLLNDGYVAKKDNWQEIEELARVYNVNCITRKTPGGAKAGNINNALEETGAPFVAIFDADHIPHRDFLRKTVRYFADSTVGFVQSPQFYKNYRENYITGGAWDQQSLFFGAICRGKNRLGAVTMCGTNMVIRRAPLMAVGGMCDTNIAEDFVTGLFIQQRGYTSVYVPEVLAEGLAPEDFLSYYKQQLRWARGSLEVLFKYNPLFKRGLTWGQKIQYLSSASYYLTGLFVLVNILIPIIFFYTGAIPFLISTMALAIVFIPYIFLMIYCVQLSSNFTYTFRAMAFSISSWTIHLRALSELLRGKKSGFSITAKRGVQGNFLKLSAPHLAYFSIVMVGIVFALMRDGLTSSVVTNSAWAILNCAIFYPFVKASSPIGAEHEAEERAITRKESLTTAYALPNQRVQ